MTEKELWNYFLEKKVGYARPVDRDFLWVTRNDFEPVRQYFVEELNLFHAGKSFRSSGYFSHIHAVEQGEYFFLHQDFGNLAKFFPLGLFHLFVDVIPFQTLAFVRGVPKKTLYTKPE